MAHELHELPRILKRLVHGLHRLPRFFFASKNKICPKGAASPLTILPIYRNLLMNPEFDKITAIE